MKKRGYLLVLVILTIVIIGGYLLILKLNENYYNVLTRIERGNEWIKENGWSDSCEDWRYYNRGCYYKQYPGLDGTDAIVGGNLQYYNLTHKEIWSLCKNFIFVGDIAYCFNQNAETAKEEKECLNFAGEDKYLKRICALKKGQLIPSETIDVNDTTHNFDSTEIIEIKGYPYISEIR